MMPSTLDRLRRSIDTFSAASILIVGDVMLDQFVVGQVRARRLPLVVVTAGGYGPTSWKIHYNSYRWMLEAP